MVDLDALLYKWISRANERRDDLGLPVGFIEDSIGLLTRVLSPDYLRHLLISEANPVHFLDDEANPLRKWLLSAMVDAHIIHVLELTAYFRVFEADPALPDKVEKLKRDRFWPAFFELAMPARMKRASRAPERVRLNPEISSSIGDFTISGPGYEVPCECSRLGRSPAIIAPAGLQESLSNRISDGTKRVANPLCVKIRSDEPLAGNTYNIVLRLLRKALADARAGKLPCEYRDGSTVVKFEQLTEESEPIPFKTVEGRVANFLGGDWDSATRLCRVPAKDSDEITGRYESGERFYEYEAVRFFTRFGRTSDQPDYYGRLTAKLRKKLKQTKISTEHFGKIVLIEVPFDLRAVDPNSLRAAVHDAAVNSSKTFAVILANREPNPHIRYHYSMSVTGNENGALLQPSLVALLKRASEGEVTVDPVLGVPYRRSWGDAGEHSRKIARPEPD
jgi:hypothetical protein